jgi:hypothetical protein
LSTTKLSSKFIHLSLYNDFWVTSSAGKDDDGLTVELPPVRVIPRKDKETLKQTIELLLEEPVPKVVYDASDNVGLIARAVGAKSWPAFVRAARSFHLEVSPTAVSLEEWRRQGRSFVAANPLWRVECKKDEMGKALEQLLQRVGSRVVQ